MRQISHDLYVPAQNATYEMVKRERGLTLDNLEDLAGDVQKLDNPKPVGRRSFLKSTAIGLAALVTVPLVSGCYMKSVGTPETTMDLDLSAHKKYDSGPIQINSIEDFLLSGEEINGTRLPYRQDLTYFMPFGIVDSPSRGDVNLSLEIARRLNIPKNKTFKKVQCEYKGKTNFPHYSIYLEATDFETPELAEAVQREHLDLMKNPTLEMRKNTEKADKIVHKHIKEMEFNLRLYTKGRYHIVFGTTNRFIDESHIKENESRFQLYEKKRGLKPVWKQTDKRPLF